MKWTVLLIPIAAIAPTNGCAPWVIDRADRNVYGLIESRQYAALGETTQVHVGAESGELAEPDGMYDLSPRPLTPKLPAAFRVTDSEAVQNDPQPEDVPPAVVEEQDADAPMTPDIFTDEEEERVAIFGLREALAYALRHARELQDAKEDLYRAALVLSLERHLWTPQFVAQFTADWTGFRDKSGLADTPTDGSDDDLGELDQTMLAVSQLGVSQRLPWGGEVTATVLHSLVRDVRNHVDEGASAQMILDAEIPLLRGVGHVAHEQRYTLERALIYGVRTYERFRRSLVVQIASDYFDLQQNRAAIGNTFKSYESRKLEWEKADFIHRMGRSETIFDAPRARDSFRSAEADLVSAKERYESALDRFKIRIGMPVSELLDVVDQSEDQAGTVLDSLLPEVGEADAVDVATAYRLDLLTSADRVDDARRGTTVDKNAILPDLILTGGVTVNPGGLVPQVGNVQVRHDGTDWRAGLALSMDDRMSERNAYRAGLIELRKAERDHELSVENVRADVRRAIRRIKQQQNLRAIQELNVRENELRLEAARAQFDLGLSTNQDVVDAEDALLRARNAYAAAVAAYRIAILEFRLDTGTLRVMDDGRWGSPSRDSGP